MTINELTMLWAKIKSFFATKTEVNTALSGKADKVAVETAIPQTGMLPNVVYSLGTTDSVAVNLDTSGTSADLKIYSFTFTAESSACQVTLPASVQLGNEYEWEFAAGRKFEVSIMDNIALVAYVDAQTTNS